MTAEEWALAQARREKLQKEINFYKVMPVDRSIYTKTEQEKLRLWKLKNEWKVKLENGYSVNTIILHGAYTALSRDL